MDMHNGILLLSWSENGLSGRGILLLLWGMLCCAACVKGQVGDNLKERLIIEKSDSMYPSYRLMDTVDGLVVATAFNDDPNDSDGGVTSNGFNRLYPTMKVIDVVDGYVVKSTIGLDSRYLKCLDREPDYAKYPVWLKGIGERNDSIYVESEDVFESEDDFKDGYIKLSGKKCEDLSFYTYNKKNYTLVSLDEIRHKYYPKLKGDVVYMINKHFIMNYVDLYKVDPDFILRVELVCSKDIAGLKSRRKFHVVRIFTKNVYNTSVGG